MTESTRERRATHDAREVIETVRAEASAKPSTYSPLYRWMWVHHDTLRDELVAVVEPAGGQRHARDAVGRITYWHRRHRVGYLW